MGIILLDREKTGIARHLPTFKRAMDFVRAGLERRSSGKRIFRMIKEGSREAFSGEAMENPHAVALASKLVLSRNRFLAMDATLCLLSAARRGADISLSIPNLLEGLRRDDLYLSSDIACALLEFCRGAGAGMRREIAMGVHELAFSPDMSPARLMEAYDGSASVVPQALLRLLSSIGEAEGLDFICGAKLRRIAKEADSGIDSGSGNFINNR